MFKNTLNNKLNQFINNFNHNTIKYRISLYTLSFVVRLIFIAYSFYYNLHHSIKYSDADYIVYSDSAKLLLSGKSPFGRHTFRYTPLLPLFMIFNHLFFHDFGKILFSVSDLIVGYLIEKSLSKCSELERYILTSLWLLNPFVIGISTRGNSDTFVCILTVSTLYFHLNKQYYISAALFGLSVHFKLFPAIYCIPFVISMYSDRNIRKMRELYSHKPTLLYKFPMMLVLKLKFRHVLFGFSSLLLFLFLASAFYLMFGFEGLFETYLYHYIRKDHRHNFSVYFNLIYSIVDGNIKLNFMYSFLPQIFLTILFSLVAFFDVPLSLFLITCSFVVLNKVLTSQYFIWWMCLIPLVIRNFKYSFLSFKEFLMSFFFMFVFKFGWLFFSFRLEHQGYNTFNEMLFCSSGLVICHMFILWTSLYQCWKNKKPEDQSLKLVTK